MGGGCGGSRASDRDRFFPSSASLDRKGEGNGDARDPVLKAFAVADVTLEALRLREGLADSGVNHFFEDVNMETRHRKQKAFLAAAFGAPTPWTGKDMRKAHENLDLRDEDFAAIAENLQATLTELKLDEKLIGEIMTIAASTKKDVLNQ